MIQERVRAVFRCPLCKTHNWTTLHRGFITPYRDLFCVDCDRKTGQSLADVKRPTKR